MGADFFPNSMNDFHASKYEKHLKYIRIGLAIVTIILFLQVLLGHLMFFTSLLGISAFLTLLFFLIASGSYFLKDLKQNNFMCVLFLTCWALDWTLIIYNQLISPFSIDLWTWALAIAITVDYIYNRISFIRLQYLFPLGILAIYILVFYGLVIWTSGLGFELPLEIFGITLVVAVAVLEAGRFIKYRNCKEGEHEQSLL